MTDNLTQAQRKQMLHALGHKLVGATPCARRVEAQRGDLCFVRGGGSCVTEARAIERHRALEFESRVRSAIADFRAEQVEADS